MFRRTAFIIFLLAGLQILPGCLDETVKPIKEPPPDDDAWPEITCEEAVIDALIWCYGHPSSDDAMTRYEGLLHPEYFFRLDEGDVAPGEDPVITRTEDIGITGEMFERHVLLELHIMSTGAWDDQPELGGYPCEGCRSTTREYVIRAQFGIDGSMYMSLPGKTFVTIVVAPDESDPEKWVIRAIYDICY